MTRDKLLDDKKIEILSNNTSGDELLKKYFEENFTKCVIAEYADFIEYTDEVNEDFSISFDKETKKVSLWLGDTNSIDMALLQAIYQKSKELGWINENNNR